jgi:hypothetical protein
MEALNIAIAKVVDEIIGKFGGYSAFHDETDEYVSQNEVRVLFATGAKSNSRIGCWRL